MARRLYKDVTSAWGFTSLIEIMLLPEPILDLTGPKWANTAVVLAMRCIGFDD